MQGITTLIQKEGNVDNSYAKRVHFGAPERVTIDLEEGNVGIGTTEPRRKLHVKVNDVEPIDTPSYGGLLVEADHGHIQMAGKGSGVGAAHLILTNTAGGNRHWTINHMATGSTWQNKFTIGYLETSVSGWDPWDADMFVTIDTTGNVGVGTTTPNTAAPNGLSGNIDVNDVYLRSVGRWASQVGTLTDEYTTGTQATTVKMIKASEGFCFLVREDDENACYVYTSGGYWYLRNYGGSQCAGIGCGARCVKW